MPVNRFTASLVAVVTHACAALCLCAPATPAQARPRHALPTVASINVCTDQLVLSLAEPRQIATLSWLSADPEESMLAERAARYPLNYGAAEELIRYAPDVVIAGTLTSAYTRLLLTELGYQVVEVAPPRDVDDIAANLERVAAAVGRPQRGRDLVDAMRARLDELRRKSKGPPVRAIVVRPGGFTTGAHSLAHQLMTLAGLSNVATEQGLDHWGSLSIETLLRSDPQLLIFTGYRNDQPSLANTVFDHPALADLAQRTRTVIVPTAQWSCGLPQSLDSVVTMRRAARIEAEAGG